MLKSTITLMSSTFNTATDTCRQLKELFNDKVDIKIVVVNDELELESVSDILVVITAKCIVREAIKYIKPGTKTIVADRVINISEISKIFEIPLFSDVLIVNNIMETTKESIEQLNACGINNYKFNPYYPGIKKWNKKCEYVVTFGERELIPDGEYKILDLGTRPLDITTCIKIATEVGIYDNIKTTISSYFFKPSINLLDKYFKQCKINETRSKELQQILDMFEVGIVVLDEYNKIQFFNPEAKNILKINNKSSQYLMNIIEKDLLSSETFFFEIEGNNYSFELLSNKISKNNISKILTINEFKKIEKIENNYRLSIVKNGLIAEYKFEDILYRSKVMGNMIQRAKYFSKSDSTIAIHGESGVGKELLAQAIHNNSYRKNEAFVAINFAAISMTLGEAELFGYEDGAFTGAKKGGKKGLFELAHNGTVFLDEIGDASLDMQKKILRVIEERKILPIGGNRVIPINIRIITATNQNLYNLVKENKFREDLYYRLNVLPIKIPSLRERKEDIIPLFMHYLNNVFNIDIDTLSDHSKYKLENNMWFGNIRELRNVAEYLSNFMRQGLDWESQLDELLVDNTFEYNKSNGNIVNNSINTIYCELENYCNPHIYMNILNVLNSSPYKWSRAMLSDELCNRKINISESKVKRYLLILKKLELIQTKTGYGTYIKQLGKEMIEYYNEFIS